ncbi:MAG: tetratricopeptide repeat protein [Thermogutta sp.]
MELSCQFLMEESRSMIWPRLSVALALIGTFVSSSLLAQTSGSGARFLEALKGRGYYDTAVEYLDLLATDPACPAELKEVIDYEAGVCLVAAAQSQRSLQKRNQSLKDAVERLRKFVQQHPKHALVDAARAQLGQVLVEQAKLLLQGIDAKPAEEANRLRGEARKLIEQAKQDFDAYEKSAYERAKQFQDKVIDPRNEQLIKEREQAYGEYLKARMFTMGAIYQLAQTYAEDEQNRSELLKQAASAYEKFYDKYKDLSAGFFARFYQGVCAQELRDDKTAIDIFKETLTVPGDSPEIQRLRTEALARLIQIYRKQGRHEEIVAQAASWEDSVRPDVRMTDWGLEILYHGALSATEVAKAAEQNKEGKVAQQHRALAQRFLKIVASVPGQYRLDAQAKMAELLGQEKTIEESPVVDFADGKARGEAAWGRFLAAMAQMEKQEGNAAQVREEANRARDQAIRFYRKAIALHKSESMEELNLIRYQLIYLFWDAGLLENSAILGEFLARNYPQNAGSQKAIEIAVKAYRNLFDESRKNGLDSSLELEKIKELTQYALSQWGDAREASECVLTLLESLFDLNLMDEAKQFLERIPPESAGRARAELRMGQVCWTQYAKSAASQEQANSEELQKLLQDAQQYLEQGLSRIRKGSFEVDYFTEYSLLLLAQLYVNTGATGQAINLLEDQTLGPLTLIQQGHGAVANPKFREEVMKVALRAYVGSQQLDKAFQIRDKLEELVAGSGDAETTKRITAVYVGLGRQLEEQLARLRAEGKTAETEKVLEGFTKFLEAIQERAEGADFRALNWVAETFLSLAKGLDTGEAKAPEQAVEYYKKALATYVQLIKRCESEPGFGPEDAPLFLRVRLAAALRGLRLFEKAMEAVLVVIDKYGKENRLDAQLEAAQIYQEWAEQPGKEQYYEYAIRGGHEKNGRYLIWGWGGIARRVANDYKRFEDVFHQSRYNLALCRLKLAQKATGPKRDQLLKEAELDIQRTYLLYPNLGGNEWRDKYDKLLRTIQQLRGEKVPQGLKAFESRPKATPAATK